MHNSVITCIVSEDREKRNFWNCFCEASVILVSDFKSDSVLELVNSHSPYLRI